MPTTVIAVIVATFLAAGTAQAAPHEFTDWSSRDSSTTHGTLRGRSVVLTSPEDVPGSVLDGTSTQWSSPLYTPSLSYSDTAEILGRNGNTYTLDFGGPTKDPVFHLYSLASTIAFPSGATVTKLSGQDDFTVSGNTVSGVAKEADDRGRTDSSGTVRVNGTFSSLTFTATPTFGDGSMADGISMQVGVRLSVPPPTTTISLVGELQPDGYYPFVSLGVEANGDPEGTPLETRCVLDPPTAPTSFDDLPAGCRLIGRQELVFDVGVHTVYAASRNATGETEAPVAQRTFRVESPPETEITEGPRGATWEATPRFAFTAILSPLITTFSSSTFECSLDGAAFAPCTTPYTAPVLRSGPHAFEVRAVDARGIADATPARAEFTLNATALKRLSCEVRGVIHPVLMLRFGEQERTTCVIGVLPAAGCPENHICVVREERCPRGAICTLIARTHWFDADLNVNWAAQARASFGPIRSIDSIGVRRPGNDRANYPEGEDICETGFDGDRCVATAKAILVGDGDPIYVACGATWVPGGGILGRTQFRDDSIRRVECEAELKIESVRPLNPIIAGIALGFLQAQVSAPGPGSMTIGGGTCPQDPRCGGAGAGGGGAEGRAAVAKKPRIVSQTQTVTEAGPVSFRLKLNPAAKRLLKRKKKLRAVLQLTFTPAGGGAPAVTTTRVTIRQPKPASKVCKRRRQRGCST